MDASAPPSLCHSLIASLGMDWVVVVVCKISLESRKTLFILSSFLFPLSTFSVSSFLPPFPAPLPLSLHSLGGAAGKCLTRAGVHPLHPGVNRARVLPVGAFVMEGFARHAAAVGFVLLLGRKVQVVPGAPLLATARGRGATEVLIRIETRGPVLVGRPVAGQDRVGLLVETR